MPALPLGYSTRTRHTLPSMSRETLGEEIRDRLGPVPRLGSRPFVSAVVPNRDAAGHLRNLLAGLSERTDYPRLELIVVDNGSSDDSVEFVRSAETPFEVSIIANSGNESFSDACNQGAEIAAGELLLFLNNDVEPFEPGWLRELVGCLQASRAGAVGATLLCRDEEHTRSFAHGYGVQHRGLSFVEEDGRAVPGLRGWEDDPLDRELGNDVECEAVAASCLLIAPATYELIGGFSSGYFYGCEDVDLCLKLRAAGMPVVCSGRSIAIHHPASTRRTIAFEKAREIKLANRRLLWQRWGPQPEPAPGTARLSACASGALPLRASKIAGPEMGSSGVSPRYVLGVHPGWHDGAAALLRDGEPIAMVEQERLSRNRHAFGESPAAAIRACLTHAGIDLGAVAEIAVGVDIPAAIEVLEAGPFCERDFATWLVGDCAVPGRPVPTLRYVEHHVAHAASAFYTSGLKEAAILVVDGKGETVATTIAVGGPAGIDVVRTWGAHLSLGHLYASAAEWAGLSKWGAGKLMGLAPYGMPGQPVPLSASEDGYAIAGAPPPDSPVASQLEQLGRRMHESFRARNYPFCSGEPADAMAYANFAASIQCALEEAILRLATIAREECGHPDLVLAGGVAQNCTANGKLIRSGIFDEVWIPPFAYDSGASIGAALVADRALGGGSTAASPRLAHPFWAPETGGPDAETLADLSECEVSAHGDGELAEIVARHLDEGRLVGWWQGRAEVGQRALGARSILCDPRRRETLVRANDVKGRESWRPLAPAVRADFSEPLFDGSLPAAAEFMLTAWPVREQVQPRIPAAVHVDGSARPQTGATRAIALLRAHPRLPGTDRGTRRDQHVIQPRGRTDRADAARRRQHLSRERARRARSGRHGRSQADGEEIEAFRERQSRERRREAQTADPLAVGWRRVAVWAGRELSGRPSGRAQFVEEAAHSRRASESCVLARSHPQAKRMAIRIGSGSFAGRRRGRERAGPGLVTAIRSLGQAAAAKCVVVEGGNGSGKSLAATAFQAVCQSDGTDVALVNQGSDLGAVIQRVDAASALVVDNLDRLPPGLHRSVV